MVVSSDQNQPSRSLNSSVAVVIPARNEEHTIGDAIRSLYRQTLLPSEIIVVDNGSSDRTSEVVKESIRDAPDGVCIRLIREETPGVAIARNAGFFKAKADIIASLDADSIPAQDWLELLVHHFSRPDVVAVSGITVVTDTGPVVRLIGDVGYYAWLTAFLRMIYGFRTVTSASCAFRATSFRSVGGFDRTIIDPLMIEDTEISSRLSLIGCIVIEPRAKVYTTFRRYSSPSKLLRNTYIRLRRWGDISRNYHIRKNQHMQAKAFG